MDIKSLKVKIRRQPTSYEWGEICVDEITSPTWRAISGGVNAIQPFYSLYGKIPYYRAAQLVACSGTHCEYNSLAWICLNKKDNVGEYAAGYKYLEGLIGYSKPKSVGALARPKGQPPCTKKILLLLSEQPITRKALRTMIVNEIGYNSGTFCRAIKSLAGREKIILEGTSNNPNQKISLHK